MKRIYIYLVILLGLVPVGANAQLTLNFESGDRSKEAGNCWAFGAVSYSSSSSHLITDKWVGRSNSMSNPSPTASWIKSPFLKLGSGNITFKVKLENTSGTTKSVRIRFITYNSSNTSTGEGAIYTDSFNFNWSTINTSVQNISYAIPSAIAGSSTPYKVIISFLGTGGNNRCNIDDIVIPGTYWADPSNNCLPLSTITDTDSDGVSDEDDAFDNDAFRAFKYYLKGEQFSTLLCEDLWPNRGDFDFNDLVVDYRLLVVANADNNVVELKFEIVTRAIGGSFHNGFACELTEIDASSIISVTGNKLNGKVFKVRSNGTEEGPAYASIPFFDDAYNVLTYPGGTGGINTNPASPNAAYDSMTVVVTFMDKGQPAAGGAISYENFIKIDRINPFLVVNQDRTKEIHLIDKKPTSLASEKLFRTGDDASEPGNNRYYRSQNNLPWMISVSRSIPYAAEKVEFSNAFPYFVKWAESEGRSYEDWYMDQSGYRNQKFIYSR